MTELPFVITGTVTDIDGSTALSSCNIIAKNLTDPGATSTTTDGSGQYILDMANATGAEVGEIISFKIYKGTKIAVSNTTITQAMKDAGGTTVNLTIKGLNQHVFSTLYSLYNSYSPPSYTDAKGDTQTWNIVSSMPEKNEDFPVIVIPPSEISEDILTFDESVEDIPITVETMFYSKARDGKSRLDKGRDYMREMLKTYKSTLNYAGLSFNKPTFIDESNITELFSGNEKYNLANQILHFRYRP